jgi:hypothetical protein
VTALNKKLTAETIQVDDDPEALYALSMQEGWGDGVPLLPPTPARVERLLAESPHAPDHVLGLLPPKHNKATVELAAINAAMAGCEPKAFPLVLAALEGILETSFNAITLLASTSSTCPMYVVNGPTREALKIDFQAGCLGGAAGRGSMTIGRAVSLCLRNIGGQRAGDTTRTVFGQPSRFGLCFGEWEERSPWPSLAVRRGFRSDQEVVTVYAGKGTQGITDNHHPDARDLAYIIAREMASPMAGWFMESRYDESHTMLLLSPVWAERFAKYFPKIESFQEYLRENAWQPIDLWRPEQQAFLREKERVDSKGRVFMYGDPNQFVPVVCGGLGGLTATLLRGFAWTEPRSVAVARP